MVTLPVMESSLTYPYLYNSRFELKCSYSLKLATSIFCFRSTVAIVFLILILGLRGMSNLCTFYLKLNRLKCLVNNYCFVEEKEVLPEGWIFASLKQISNKIHYGYTAKSSIQKSGTKYLRITDIQNNSVIWEKVPYCEIPEEKSDQFILKPNDLVFARTGATVGKSLLLKNPPKSVFASYLIRVVFS